MSAIMTDAGTGVLTCNGYAGRDWSTAPGCPSRFPAAPGESVQSAEDRARAAGWKTLEFAGSVGHVCPDPRSH